MTWRSAARRERHPAVDSAPGLRADRSAGLAEHARDSGHLLCIVCRRSLRDDEPQSCVHCLGSARRNLQTITELYVLLPEETVDRGGITNDPIGRGGSAETPLPGGDALVMLAGGNAIADRDASPADPTPVLALLAEWENDWRHTIGQSAAGRATMVTVTGWLNRHLGWAAANHPAFDDFAHDLANVRGELEAVLRCGPQRSPVPCITCDHRALERPIPADGDRDRTEILWQCGHCHRRYTAAEYWMAAREQMEQHDSQPLAG